jgi:hypothetical protein
MDSGGRKSLPTRDSMQSGARESPATYLAGAEAVAGTRRGGAGTPGGGSSPGGSRRAGTPRARRAETPGSGDVQKLTCAARVDFKGQRR